MRARHKQSLQSSTNVGLLPLGTSVLWIGCVAVGMAGLLIPYPHEHMPAIDPKPVQAMLMRVELSNDPAPPEIQLPVPQANEPPPAVPSLPETVSAPAALPLISVSVPEAPPLVPVAAPAPAAAFAAPTEGPTRPVATIEANTARPPPGVVKAPSPRLAAAAPQRPTRLVLGQGEGRQPLPKYPREAEMARQQGTVVIQFTVGEDGTVRTANLVSPSPFALLNQAAIRAVRETWRFSPGPVRSYEVSIRFDFKQR